MSSSTQFSNNPFANFSATNLNSASNNSLPHGSFTNHPPSDSSGGNMISNQNFLNKTNAFNSKSGQASLPTNNDLSQTVSFMNAGGGLGGGLPRSGKKSTASTCSERTELTQISTTLTEGSSQGGGSNPFSDAKSMNVNRTEYNFGKKSNAVGNTTTTTNISPNLGNAGEVFKENNDEFMFFPPNDFISRETVSKDPTGFANNEKYFSKSTNFFAPHTSFRNPEDRARETDRQENSLSRSVLGLPQRSPSQPSHPTHPNHPTNISESRESSFMRSKENPVSANNQKKPTPAASPFGVLEKILSKTGTKNTSIGLLQDDEFFTEEMLFLLQEEDNNLANYREIIEKEKAKLEQDVEFAIKEIGNTIEEVKNRIVEGLDDHYKLYIAKYKVK